MTYRIKTILFWLFSFFFTISIAYYQRTTGPTYPVRGSVEIAGEKIKYKLLRTQEGDVDAEIKINAPANIEGNYRFKRYKSHDEWTEASMAREGEQLIAALPNQPPAGKVMYQITLKSGDESVKITAEPVVLRYKGIVPANILWTHIILMFMAMMFSTRTGLEAIIKGKHTYIYTIITILLLIPGGLILGPVVQKYAFDAYWTGWPLGHDLTDNKTAFAFIFWLVAFFRLRKNRAHTLWALVAAVMLLIVYLVPHSAFGSEIDYTQQNMP